MVSSSGSNTKVKSTDGSLGGQPKQEIPSSTHVVNTFEVEVDEPLVVTCPDCPDCSGGFHTVRRRLCSRYTRVLCGLLVTAGLLGLAYITFRSYDDKCDSNKCNGIIKEVASEVEVDGTESPLCQNPPCANRIPLCQNPPCGIPLVQEEGVTCTISGGVQPVCTCSFDEPESRLDEPEYCRDYYTCDVNECLMEFAKLKDTTRDMCSITLTGPESMGPMCKCSSGTQCPNATSCDYAPCLLRFESYLDLLDVGPIAPNPCDEFQDCLSNCDDELCLKACESSDPDCAKGREAALADKDSQDFNVCGDYQECLDECLIVVDNLINDCIEECSEINPMCADMAGTHADKGQVVVTRLNCGEFQSCLDGCNNELCAESCESERPDCVEQFKKVCDRMPSFVLQAN